jgi:hypothetical protein
MIINWMIQLAAKNERGLALRDALASALLEVLRDDRISRQSSISCNGAGNTLHTHKK